MPVILAIDTSAKTVSCAIMQDDRLLASYYADTGLTHSQTLMPMIRSLLDTAGLAVEKLDAIAVNAGPGSFTGVRIGVSAVKGLAFTYEMPCISVSTLEAMACPLAVSPDTLICCVMDARCQQVYTALFRKTPEGETQRLTEDAAMSLDELGACLAERNCPVMLVGDGSLLCQRYFGGKLPVQLAPAAVRYQNATGTAMTAMKMLAARQVVSAEDLLPVYLRLPQAERELRQRQQSEYESK